MTTWVGRYAMVAGQVREHGPWLVDRQRQREDEVLRLLVLAEPVDDRSAEFCNEVAEAVAALFARESLSITGGLLRALQQTHANLAEWNRRSLREHRVAVGVTCVVVREGEVTIAQVGPGVAYVHDPGGVTRLSTEGLPAEMPMGADDAIEPRFTASNLHGREILLLTSAAEQAVGTEAVEAALRLGAERSLADLFRQTREVRDMTAVLVADLDLAEEQVAPPLEEWDDPVEGREVALAPVESGPPPESEPPRRRGPVRRVGRASGPSLPRLREAPLAARGADGGRDTRRIATIAAAALAALALLLAAWAVLPGLLSEDREAQLEEAIGAAQAQLQLAETSDRVDEQRGALRLALQEVERARAIAPGDPRIGELEARAETRLAVLDAVTPVETLTTLVAFDGTITAPVTAEAIATGGQSVWLIERERGRVIRVERASGDPAEVYRSGEAYGSAEAAARPLAMAWDASTGRLLVLDESHALYAIADAPAARPEPVPLRDADAIRSITAIAVYLGNLYLLDAEGNEVWRYLPAADGFDSERTGILGNVDLDQPTALAVDGDVFVQDGGTLRRFRQGRELPPLLHGIDQPPETPVGLVEDVPRGLFYVADRGQRRVVVGERDGGFLRQFRHPDFADLRGVAVSPDGATVYVLTGDHIAAFSASGN